jgi:hypothetical protein
MDNVRTTMNAIAYLRMPSFLASTTAFDLELTSSFDKIDDM